MSQIPRNILSWSEFSSTEKRLRDAREAIQHAGGELAPAELFNELAAAVEQMTESRNRSFPLLLSHGLSLQLCAPPIALHLLPPLNSPKQRFILALFYLNDGQATAQIVRWDIGDDTASSVLSLPHPPSDPPRPSTIEGCRHRLNRPPSDLQAAKLGKTGLARLEFSQGLLEINFDEERGISHCQWSEQSEAIPDEWIQRSSWQDMPIIARFKRVHQALNWQDDQLLSLSDGKPTALPKTTIGRIRGADGLAVGKPVYLASNQGKVFRLQDNIINKQSEPFGNEILDALLLGKDQKNTHLLIVEKEGYLYLLDRELEVKHWQNLERHIVRLIGNGGTEFVAVDKSGGLLPLRQYDPGQFKALPESEILAEHLLKRDGVWQFPEKEEILNQLQTEHEKLLRLCGVALDQLFRHLHDDPPYIAAFAHWLNALNTLYPQLTPLQHQALTEIHRRLLRHALRWVINSCYCDRAKDSAQGRPWTEVFADRNNQIHPALAVVFDLLTLPEAAADELWLILLRRRDWVDRWARYTKLIGLPGFHQKLRQLHDHIQRCQEQFLSAFAELRPLNILRSFRLQSPVIHMDALEGGLGYLAILTADRQLRIVDVNKKQNDDWLVTDKWPDAQLPWSGRPSFVRCLPPIFERHRLLVGGMRGELAILEWQLGQKQPTVIRKLDCEFSLCCSRSIPNRQEAVVLLGGRHKNGKACLYRWLPDHPKLKPVELWQDNVGLSSLCMLRHSEQKLWALNRDRGQLLVWDFKSVIQANKLPQPERWLVGVHKLYSLEYIEERNALICGGEGGRIWCLDAITGSPRWLVHAPGDLRHVRYLKEYANFQSICLLTCDDGSNLLVDEHGDIICIYERLGTINALISMELSQDQHLVTATQSGRLVVLGKLKVDGGAPAGNANPNGELPVRASAAEAYPLRNPRAPLIIPKQPYQEAILNLYCFKKIVEYLEEKRFLDVDLSAIWPLMIPEGQDNLNSLVFLLFRLKKLNLDNLIREHRELVFSLVHECWKTVKSTNNRPAGAWYCKVLGPARQILEQWPDRAEAEELLGAIKRDTWSVDAGNERKLSLRLFLAIRCWNQSAIEEIANAPLKLDLWCNALAEESGASNTEQLSATIAELTRESLNLLPGDPWWQWLTDLANTRQPMSEPRPPGPLRWLYVADCEALSQQAVTQLGQLFPNNRAWHNWLDNLQVILASLRNNRHSLPHAANREHGDWLRLRDHLAKGFDSFAIVKDVEQQTLLALCWPSLHTHWETLIQQGQNDLEKKIFAQPENYLDLRYRDLWHSEAQVELHVQIDNRFRGVLELHNLRWNGEEVVLHDLPLTIQSRKTTALTINLFCQQERLSGELRLTCREQESNRPLSVTKLLDIPRGVAILSDAPEWQPTWQRLMALLDDFQTRNIEFHWLNGDVWSSVQRRRLERDVSERFGYDTTADRDPVNLPWFSPDLALAVDAHIQLAQLHALLPALPGGDARLWALAFWHWADRLPDLIAEQIPSLPNNHQVEAILNKLFADNPSTVSAIKAELQSIPARAFGAWCARLPFYVAAPNENLSAGDLYLPPAMLIDAVMWSYLDRVSDDQVAPLLGMQPEIARMQRQSRRQFQRHFPLLKQGGNQYSDDFDQLVQQLLHKLGNGEISFNKEFDYWRIQLEKAVSVKWDDYRDCHLLPRQSAIKRAELKIDASAKPLWLCIGESNAPALQGTALAMTENDLLAILHAEDLDDVQLWLNRRYAEQRQSIDTSEVFRCNGGMGALVAKHFYGKDDDIARLKACLSNTDHTVPGVNCRESVLLIGGRRMGKTSLRERILYLMQLEQPDRVCWPVNFEALPQHLHGNDLERWFMLRLADASLKSPHPLTPDWPDQYKDSAHWRDRNRQLLVDHLDYIRGKVNLTVLWIFDETDWLAKADTQDSRTRWQLFSFFRQLINNGKVCIFATAYPYGADEQYALSVAMHNSSHTELNPIYNTFTQAIDLSPWKPREAWEFIHSRLAGLGVILPHRYREEFLLQTRGLMWAVHEFGEEICKALPKHRRLKMVDAEVWRQAQQASLQRMLHALKTSVDQAGRRQDAQFNISPLREPEASLEHQLWLALVNCCQAPREPICDAEQWLEPLQRVSLRQLKSAMPKVKEDALVAALNELTASAVLAGNKQDRYSFCFTYNLLPTWKYLMDRERDDNGV